tara:strand:+ start:1922 stop:2206 length:285 start_codon:yes stop_codon:yes gene_type:complete
LQSRSSGHIVVVTGAVVITTGAGVVEGRNVVVTPCTSFIKNGICSGKIGAGYITTLRWGGGVVTTLGGRGLRWGGSIVLGSGGIVPYVGGLLVV